ncbi:MAG: APC family permease [Vagococcus sp.]
MEEGELKKEITLFGAFSTVMGTVIGAGVFFKSSSVASAAGTTSLALLAWGLGGFLTLCAGLTSSELATAIPKTGGAVKYIEYTYGKLWGFLLGWAQSVIYFPANIAALSIIFSTQFVHLFRFSPQVIVPIAVVTGISVTAINLLGAKLASRFQSISLLLKLIPIILIVVCGLFVGSSEVVSVFPIEAGKNQTLIGGLSAALFATMFAYDGWLGVGAVAGEMKHPEKDLPKAIVLGLSFIMVVYVLINGIFLKVLSFEQVSGNIDTASDVSRHLFGNVGGKMVTLGILISVYGALNGYTMTGIRVPYALAEDNLLPFSHYFLRLSKKTKVPYVAAFIQLIISITMMLFGSFDVLTDMLVFVMWLFSVLIFVAVFILRRREPDLIRPYKVPLYPVVPIIACIGGLFILFTTLLTDLKLALMGIGITALGIPIYMIKHKTSRD